jgi:hypothetical protein
MLREGKVLGGAVVWILLSFSARSAWGVAWTLDGVVSIARNKSTLSSQGTIYCLGILGGPESNCIFNGSHSITDTQDQLPIANDSAVVLFQAYWADFESGVGDAGSCYQANLQGLLPSTGATVARVAGALCIPNVPDKPPPTDCPVIIDLDGHGFKLTGLDDPVRFDLDASGQAEEIGWTAAGVRNGFLCLDRNHDGAITDGRELFGQVTPLANGQPAKIGYAAMAELDRPALGGNGDGFLGPEDAAFQDLCVWVDANHDGVSQPDEILTLEQAGIVRLAYDYVETRRQDSHGNLFRYKSKAWGLNPAGRVREITSYDVFFVQSPN